MLLVPLSLAAFLHTNAFFRSLLFQFERLGIFYKTCFQMLGSDVTMCAAARSRSPPRAAAPYRSRRAFARNLSWRRR